MALLVAVPAPPAVSQDGDEADVIQACASVRDGRLGVVADAEEGS
jgi:hypothetical protein